MASIMISVIVSLVIGIGIGAFGIEMINRSRMGNSSQDSGVGDVNNDLASLETKVAKVSNLIRNDATIYQVVSKNRTLAENIYETVSKKQSAVGVSTSSRQPAPSRVTEAEQFTVPQVPELAPYQPRYAAKPDDWREEAPAANTQPETVREQPQPSSYTPPAYEQPANVQPANTQPAQKSPQAAEAEQEQSLRSMEQIFTLVEKLRRCSPSYRLYNPNTRRLEFTPDATADYIVIERDNRLFVFPNQISRFHKKHLEEALYRCNVNYIGEECTLKNYCIADEAGNILSVGAITG